jgi:hypothetical protein
MFKHKFRDFFKKKFCCAETNTTWHKIQNSLTASHNFYLQHGVYTPKYEANIMHMSLYDGMIESFRTESITK